MARLNRGRVVAGTSLRERPSGRSEWCKWTLRFAIGSCVGALVTLAIYNNVVPS